MFDGGRTERNKNSPVFHQETQFGLGFSVFVTDSNKVAILEKRMGNGLT